MLHKSLLRAAAKHKSHRSGLSILEVLVSIGILTLGLLGVVVLIPIAAQKLRRGIGLDDSTAIARSALADFEARGANNMQRWLRYHPTATPPHVAISPAGTQMLNLWGVQQTFNPLVAGVPAAAGNSYIHPTWSFCIDPLMYESVNIEPPNGGLGRDNTYFPYQPFQPQPNAPVHFDHGRQYVYSFNANPMPSGTLPAGIPSSYGRMIRVGLNWNPIDWKIQSAIGPVASLNVGLAENVFRNSDDLLLGVPGQEPQEGLSALTALQTDLPASQFDVSMQSWDLPATTRVKRNATGNMSWFATMVPLQGTMSSNGSRYYTLSVAVVEKRDLVIDQLRETSLESDDLNNDTVNLVESERTAGVRFVAGGEGGGEIQLVSRIAPTNDVQKALAYKNLGGLREGNWILISGPQPDVPGGTVGGNIFYWYKIVGIEQQPQVWQAGPAAPVEVVRHATLRGPDWPVGVSYSNYSGQGFQYDGEAIIVSNVINVFEKTVEIRGD